MSSQKNRRIINIFIGSPSDLEEERKIAREVVQGLNAYIARHLDVHVVLIGWEDTPPSSIERPQSLINQDLLSCDLFVGLLWNRWGTKPDKGGDNDSGFEEEFRLALDQLSQKKIDDVWVFFKQMTTQLQKDPGEQATKVISFKKEITSEFSTLYKTFETNEQWREMFTFLLADYVIKKIKSSGIDSEVKEKASAQPTEVEERDGSFLSLDFILSMLKDDPNQLIDIQHQRAHLYTFSLAQQFSTSSGFLQADEIIALYYERENIKLKKHEKFTLMREVMGSADTKPGWFWIDLPQKDFMDHCRSLAQINEDTPTRVECFAALAVLGDTEIFSDLEKAIESGGEYETQQLLKLYLKYPKHSRIDFLWQLLDNQNSYIRGLAAKGIIDLTKQAKIDSLPEIAFELAANHGINDWNMKRTINDDIEIKDLPKFLTIIDDNLRFIAFSKCIQSLGVDEINTFREDKNENVRILALHTLIVRGEPITKQEIDHQQTQAKQIRESQKRPLWLDYAPLSLSDWFPLKWDDVLFEYYKADPKTGEQEISWIDIDNYLVWGAIVDADYENHKDELRTNLNDRFKGFRDRAISNWEKTRTIQIPETYFDDSSIDIFVRSRFCKIGMEILLKHHTKDDIPIALGFFELPADNSYRTEILKTCIKIIQAQSSEVNLDAILNIYEKVEYDLQRELAQLALSIAEERWPEVIEILLGSDNSEIIKDVLSVALSSKNLIPEEKLISLLYREHSIIRLTALEYLTRTHNVKFLIQLLDQYPSSSSFGYYYHDVLCWLDRIIYAPDYISKYLHSGLSHLSPEVE